VHEKEILKLHGKIKEKNLVLVPLKIFFVRNWAKIEIALGKGKKVYDKREAIKKKELQRSIKEIQNKYP
jgi:SsrA-binding protein